MNKENVEKLVVDLLKEIGEDPKREGLLKTPHRVAKSYDFLTSGYKKDIGEILNGAVFNEKYDEMVLVKNIDFYIPDGKIVGLSKIPRIVEVFSRRLQVQERMTQEIADTINKYLEPQGVAVVSEAYHMCMMMRGVEKQNSSATASAVHGIFQEDARTRAEFMNLIAQKNL